MMLIGRVELKKLFGMVGIIILVGGLIYLIVPHLPKEWTLFDRVTTWENRVDQFLHGSEIPEYEVKTVDGNYQYIMLVWPLPTVEFSVNSGETAGNVIFYHKLIPTSFMQL